MHYAMGGRDIGCGDIGFATALVGDGQARVDGESSPCAVSALPGSTFLVGATSAAGTVWSLLPQAARANAAQAHSTNFKNWRFICVAPNRLKNGTGWATARYHCVNSRNIYYSF